MDLFYKVKAALRVSTDDEGISEEIKSLIDSGKRDLITTGITNVKDPLFEMAIIIYCKGHFGFDNPEAQRFIESYESIKQKMMDTEEYRDAE